VAGGGDGRDGAGNGAGCVVAKRDPGGQVEQRVDGELPLLGDGRDYPVAVPDEGDTAGIDMVVMAYLEWLK
jgi:hypothetical protein